LIRDNRNSTSYIEKIEVEMVISYTTPLGVTPGDVPFGHPDPWRAIADA
jgi:hypothetical protein